LVREGALVSAKFFGESRYVGGRFAFVVPHMRT